MEEEIRRVVPLIERLAAAGIAVSVDTWRAPVARAALEAGAAMVNDVSALSDPERGGRVRGGRRGARDHPHARGAQAQGVPRLRRRGGRRARALARARRRGAGARRGARTSSCSTRASTWPRRRRSRSSCCAGCRSCASAGRPLLLAISRKDFIGALTGRPPASREAGTLAALEACVEGGAAIVRLHDVAAAADYLRVREALLGEDEVAEDLHLDRGPAQGAGWRDAPFTIAQISDIHCGSAHFVPSLLERAIVEVNDLSPDVVIVSGDLTDFGLRGEFQSARDYLDRIDCERMIVIPGNHDSRNVGYVHFEELFGERRSELHSDGVSIVAVDSTEPDLDHGVIGRGRYEWIEERFASHEAYLRIFVMHHHLLPVPGTGPRAQHRARRRRHARVPPARGRPPGALGPQARALRLAAREPVRGQRRHGLDHPPARQDQALLQRDRGDARAGHDLPQVPVPRERRRSSRSTRAPTSTRRTSRCWARRPTASAVPAIALVDGEHHPAAVRDALDALDAERGVAGVVFCGGEEKLGPGSLEEQYGRPTRDDPEAALRELAPEADAVVDLADEPVVPAGAKLRLAALALHLGLAFETPGRAARAAPLRAGRLRRAQAGGDRDRQAHRQDRRGRPLGRAAARPRPGDRVHGPRRAGRAAAGGGGDRAGRPAGDGRAGEATARPTTSRTPCSPACARWAAGGWAAAWRASRPSRTWPRARRSPRRSTPG